MNTFYTEAYAALSEPTRCSIIELLACEGELSATDISNDFTTSAQAISQHLKVLREANLVKMEKRAQQRIYQINPDAMRELEKWPKHIRELWSERFDRLDALLKSELKKVNNLNRKEK
jgi:DNA-binding transcriptional ArsR family regulator